MKKYSLKNYKRGWIIGNFEPAIYKTDAFETAVKKYQKGDTEKAHYHKITREYTVIISGRFRVNGTIIDTGDIIEIGTEEICNFECIETGDTLVVKVPSVKEDKYLL